MSKQAEIDRASDPSWVCLICSLHWVPH
jgi:hypothetical protein